MRLSRLEVSKDMEMRRTSSQLKYNNRQRGSSRRCYGRPTLRTRAANVAYPPWHPLDPEPREDEDTRERASARARERAPRCRRNMRRRLLGSAAYRRPGKGRRGRGMHSNLAAMHPAV